MGNSSTGDCLVEVTVGLEGLQWALSQLQQRLPVGAGVYVCRSDGMLLAGSSLPPHWTSYADETTYIKTGVLAYKRIFDMPWAQALPLKAVEKRKEVEIRTDGDYIVVHPLAADAWTNSSTAQLNRYLRVVAFVPRSGAASVWLERLAYACGVLAAMYAVPASSILMIVLIVASVKAICCCCGCFCLCCKRNCCRFRRKPQPEEKVSYHYFDADE